MGGSAIAADLVLGAYRERIRVPMTVVRDYYLPGWIGEGTLVILSSYSGGTEETLTGGLPGARAQQPLRGDHERRQARLVLRGRGRADHPRPARPPAAGRAAAPAGADGRACSTAWGSCRTSAPTWRRPARRSRPRSPPSARTCPRSSNAGQAARPGADLVGPADLGRRADGAGRRALEGPAQRERQDAGLRLGAAGARPQRDLRLRGHARRAEPPRQAGDAARPAPPPPGASGASTSPASSSSRTSARCSRSPPRGRARSRGCSTW